MFNILLLCVSSFALLIVSITMLARANDLRWRKGWHWNFRLFGFILSGVAPVGVVGYNIAMREYPSVYEVLFHLGIMFVFLTTPYLPPWWKWISGVDQEPVIQRADRRTGIDRRRDEQP